MARNITRKKIAGNGPSLLLWLGIALIVVIADQFTKVLVWGYYQLGESTAVNSYFNIVRAHNHGAAFSFLNVAGGWQRWLFTALALGAVGVILWMLKTHAGQRLFCFALACIMGGALGNLIDRLVHGYVIDFLDFHWHDVHFYAFNLADSAITLGAACLLVDELIRVRRGT